MSIDRKDGRFKIDAEWHAQLVWEAEHDGADIGEWVEQLVLRELRSRVSDSIKRAAFAERLGISGKVRD